ncbi:MAG: hypothetical protein ACYS8Z_05150 [Planctomycetota bacterium]|jgi:hypothetical protein
MRIILFLLAILVFLGGAGIFAGAQSAIHEIEAFILFVICSVLISGAAVVEAVNLLRKELAAARNAEGKTPSQQV